MVLKECQRTVRGVSEECQRSVRGGGDGDCNAGVSERSEVLQEQVSLYIRL
jgi:hypothetical protein